MPKVNKARRNRAKAASVPPNTISNSPLVDSVTKVDSLKKENIANTDNNDNNNNSTGDSKNKTNADGSSSLSRGQRKRNAKREQYLKREQMILSTLSLRRKEEQTKRIDGLDALKDALSGLSSDGKKSDDPKTSTHTKNQEAENTVAITTNKAKKELAAKEITHMNLVLQHPSFKENPFATIQEHLKNTLSDQKQQQTKQFIQNKKEQQKQEKLKQQKKKEKLTKARNSVNKRNNKIGSKGRKKR